MKLSVIIVSYNVRYYLEQCIDSVLHAKREIETEIFVVDNHSHDGSVQYLTKRFGRRIQIIDSNHNLGFARANNIAIRQAQGEYVLLLNPDTFLSEQCLTMCVDFLDAHPEAGAVGVRMHNANGLVARESRRGLPTPLVSLMKMLGSSGRYYMSHLPWDEPGQIEVISGAFCMLRHSVLDKVGLLDEDFFMYGEDIDLSCRVMKGGFQNWYVPTDIVHYKGESTQKTSFRYVHVFYQAMLIFFRKHYGHLTYLMSLPVTIAIYLRAFMALIAMQYHRMRRSLGFFSKRTADVHYLFVGSPSMLDMCQRLTRRKGLTASFVDKKDYDRDTIAQGTCVVYDTSTFSYQDIIDEGTKNYDKSCDIGTFNPRTRILITTKEVIK